MAQPSPPPSRACAQDASYVDRLIREIVAECPRRGAGSPDERRAQEIIQRELEALGLSCELLPFRFGTHLYAALMLHAGVALLGSLLMRWLPIAGLLLHLMALGSLWAELERRGYLLRRLLPWRPSQNLLAVRPASGEPLLRLLLIGHADAAYSGWMFHPAMIRSLINRAPPPALRFFRKSMRLPLALLALLLGLDLLAIWFGASLWLAVPAWLASVPLLLLFLLNLQLVLRNRIVPGANDNLSACAALPILARRLLADLPDTVELVCVVTGAEEAGTGGAYQLVRAKQREWSRATTIPIALDGLSNGQLRCFGEGELREQPLPRWLEAIVSNAHLPDEAGGGIPRHELRAGATDVLPFLLSGYTGLSLGCIDPAIGAPRHYHRPSDTPDNLDLPQLERSLDLVEEVVRDLIGWRLGKPRAGTPETRPGSDA